MYFQKFEDSGTEVNCTIVKYNHDNPAEPIVIGTEVITHEPLLQCPHCGGKAIIKPRVIFDIPGAIVRCEQCHSTSGAENTAKPLLAERALTLPEVIEEITKKWNRRI